MENEDLEKRVKGFNGELIELLKKYKLALGALPLILQNGTLGARPHLFDEVKTENKPEETKLEKA